MRCLSTRRHSCPDLSVYNPRPFDYGKSLEFSELRKPRTATVATFTTKSKKRYSKSDVNKAATSSTLEFLRTSNLRTYNDKLNFFNRSILTTPLLKISVEASTFKGGALKPFWNERCQELSNALWLPTKTDCVALDSSYWNGSSPDTELFWRSLKTMKKTTTVTSQPTYSLSLPTSLPSCMAHETTNAAEGKFKTTKIRIYPSPKMKSLLRQCCGASRYFFNQTNAFLKKQRTKKPFLNLITMRKIIMKSDKDLDESERWQAIVPYDTRQLAIKECITCYKSNETKMKKKLINHYNVNYKTKKAPSQTFFVNKNALNDGKLFVRRFKTKKQATLRTRKRTRKLLNSDSEGDFTIQYHNNKWYVCLLKKQSKKQKAVCEQHAYRSVFLDPGFRSFQSFYSPDGYCGYTDDTYETRCRALLNKVDSLQSLHDKPTRRLNKHNVRKRIQKTRSKVSDTIDDLHWKFGNFLCKNFKTVLIPSFKTQPMLTKANNRKVSSSSARICNVYKHYQFRQRLHHVAKKYNTQIVVITEPYTSKTCGRCGYINYLLGGSKTFHCPSCNMSIDRDLNGARNNGLAYLAIHNATI